MHPQQALPQQAPPPPQTLPRLQLLGLGGVLCALVYIVMLPEPDGPKGVLSVTPKHSKGAVRTATLPRAAALPDTFPTVTLTSSSAPAERPVREFAPPAPPRSPSPASPRPAPSPPRPPAPTPSPRPVAGAPRATGSAPAVAVTAAVGGALAAAALPAAAVPAGAEVPKMTRLNDTGSAWLHGLGYTVLVAWVLDFCMSAARGNNRDALRQVVQHQTAQMQQQKLQQQQQQKQEKKGRKASTSGKAARGSSSR
eukprot:TRINITY_DN16638_c5_g1_i1.p1 TRINITY_DN16638_c5_g1~~TRINITY_DN16638_c5_g1_i1.p1  ORF type:complete len:278 (+),score=103.85 TRINITY_DN16638_c5_g1_i1:78-836(+)